MFTALKGSKFIFLFIILCFIFDETDRMMNDWTKISTKSTTPVFIFGVYLQFDNNLASLKQHVSTLLDIWNVYNENGDVMMLVDFNARYAELPTARVQKSQISTLNRVYTFKQYCASQ